jgi:cytoskeleton-associated protein 5
MRALLLRLVDDHLGKLPEGEALLKALNMLMLKILEACNRTAAFSVLLGLLLESPAAAAAPQSASDGGSGGQVGDGEARGASAAAAAAAMNARWSDLVVKCLIKITKSLPTTIEVRVRCRRGRRLAARPS